MAPSLVDQYQESAAAQMVGTFSDDKKWIGFHTVGIAEELAELEEALAAMREDLADPESCRRNVVAEMGDVCWYFSQLLFHMGIKMEEVVSISSGMALCAGSVEPSLSIGFGKLFGKVKRQLLGREYNRDELLTVARNAMASLLECMRQNDISLAEVLKYNNEKLVARFQRGTILGDGDER
eukprot:TRINITY_DN3610_c0_g1_i1.p1 TRINITY_DN3610_c0_g1~~TRINITY_DN3610_c0_g1_i1.p1  ORF type:complete len:181 (-),score=50.92 TRINITY_DN3610_c0_g1_i1:67-609(-)